MTDGMLLREFLSEPDLASYRWYIPQLSMVVGKPQIKSKLRWNSCIPDMSCGPELIAVTWQSAHRCRCFAPGPWLPYQPVFTLG